jgi:hypothetical protein
MTRLLSELFGVEEHLFRDGLKRLERMSGYDSADVRLTADIVQATKRKLTELGLNAEDTSGHELFAALKQRLKEDDEKLREALLNAAGSHDYVQAVAHALKHADSDRTVYALKAPVLKRFLKQHAPKRTMKQLGYRSLDSMLKHESVASLLAAAWLIESITWRRAFHESYKKLKAGDFESREIAIVTPSSERWQKLADALTNERKHTVVALKEVGAIVLLPQPQQVPPAVVTATLILALQSLNEIRTASVFLKLNQFHAEFGAVVQDVVADEPLLSTDLLDQSVPWRIIQRYYARFPQTFRSELFEPHIQAQDLSWHAVEHSVSSIAPELAFWVDTDHLALLEAGQPVSMNLLDVALAVCNDLPYEQRIVHYLRHSLGAELLLKYLKHDAVETVVARHLDAGLATEPALA